MFDNIKVEHQYGTTFQAGEDSVFVVGPMDFYYDKDAAGEQHIRIEGSTITSEFNNYPEMGRGHFKGDWEFDGNVYIKTNSIYAMGPNDSPTKAELMVTPAESDIVIPQSWLNAVTKSGIARTTSEIGPRYIQAVKNFRFTIQPGTSAGDLISVTNTTGYALVITYNLIFYSDKTYSVRGIIHGLHYADAFYVGDIIQIYFPKISGWTFPTYADS